MGYRTETLAKQKSVGFNYIQPAPPSPARKMFQQVSSFFGKTTSRESQRGAASPSTPTQTTGAAAAASSSSTTNHSTSSLPTPQVVSFPTSELYLKQRQGRSKSMAQKQEASNVLASRIGRQSIAVEKELANHGNHLRSFKHECTLLPKSSLVHLTQKV